MELKRKYNLFEVTGIELEYMIVDRDTLKVNPIADMLMYDKSGEYAADIYNGRIEWSNELVNHVIELKTHKPESSLRGVATAFQKNIEEINNLLAAHNAMLLPSASHPFMNPESETVLWKHDYSEIYDLYNRIFECRGHGWSNLQSMHLNLPFSNDEEFSRLHTAIRLLLPIIPALSASSPMLDGKLTGWSDSRMEAYLHHQELVPSLMGKLIPEAISGEDEYYLKIFNPIKKDIGPMDKNNVMEHHFLNSRGAIARFDRGAIEIRVIDIQECPDADIAVASLITEVLRLIINEKWAKYAYQSIWHEDDLFNVFHSVIKNGENTGIENGAYLKMFGVTQNRMKALDLWRHLYNEAGNKLNRNDADHIKLILQEGTLSSRIVKKMDGNPDHYNILKTYRQLADCLNKNVQFQ